MLECKHGLSLRPSALLAEHIGLETAKKNFDAKDIIEQGLIDELFKKLSLGGAYLSSGCSNGGRKCK